MSDQDRFETEVMAEQWFSQEIGELAGALSKAQGAVHGAVKGAENPFFKSRYADLAQVWDACREQLASNNLAVIQTTEPHPDGVVVVTTLAHSSGQWIKGKLLVRPMKADPQAMGSAITYGRRYALAAMVGIAQVDDDAESAMNRGPINGQSVNINKINTVVEKALKIANEEDDIEEGERARRAKYLVDEVLSTDEELEFQKKMKEIKIGRRTAWAIFNDYYSMKEEAA